MHLIAFVNVLIDNFVSHHLGDEHLIRNYGREQNTNFSMETFGNNIVILWESTYLYAKVVRT